MKYLLSAASASVLLLAGCGEAVKETTLPTTDASAGSAPANTIEVVVTEGADFTFDEAGIDLTQKDETVHPGDNFYQYVHGKWLDSFEIPADKSRYGSFTYLRDGSEQRVRGIIDEVAGADPEAGTLEAKIASIYNAYMDMEAIEARGLEPVQPYLAQIAAIETREDLARTFGENGFAAPFGGWVDVDSKQTDQYIFYMGYGGLGMGDRDYYLKDTDKNLELRAAYAEMLTTLLTEAGYDTPADAAQSIIALETEMAKAHWDRAASRDRNITYNKMDREALSALAGDFPLDVLMSEMGLGELEELVVRQVTPTPEEAEELGYSEEQLAKVSGGGVETVFDIAANHDLDAWKAWLSARFLSNHSDVLPARIDEAVFAFYGKALRGQEQQRDRWKRAVSTVEGSVGEAVGKIYAERYFPAANKAAMDDLVANLRKAMASNLDELPWMGEETKDQARDKLAKFTPKIGYPEKFETYEGLEVSDQAFENDLAVGEWSFKDMLSKLGQPIDKTEWFMLPQTVNAYYSPNRNEIVFPAAILQPPFFNIDADPAVNYGGIGGVIGHEIGHGFDDQGSKSDGDGVLRNWWTADDKAAFEARTGALAGQYDAFCPLDEGDTCVNGRLGLGENIGDLGGLSMSYKAYQLSLDTDGDGVVSEAEQPPVINGLTGDQRFFISWAQIWRNKYRDDALRAQLVRGPHSPPRYRVNGVVRNFDAWYEEFDVGPEHELYIPPEERVRIW